MKQPILWPLIILPIGIGAYFICNKSQLFTTVPTEATTISSPGHHENLETFCAPSSSRIPQSSLEPLTLNNDPIKTPKKFNGDISSLAASYFSNPDIAAFAEFLDYAANKINSEKPDRPDLAEMPVDDYAVGLSLLDYKTYYVDLGDERIKLEYKINHISAAPDYNFTLHSSLFPQPSIPYLNYESLQLVIHTSEDRKIQSIEAFPIFTPSVYDTIDSARRSLEKYSFVSFAFKTKIAYDDSAHLFVRVVPIGITSVAKNDDKLDVQIGSLEDRFGGWSYQLPSSQLFSELFNKLQK